MDSGFDRYLLSSAMAGIYVLIAMFFVLTITSIIKLQFPEVPIHRIIYGMAFGISLSMIVMAGAELFTGNNMAMVIGL